MSQEAVVFVYGTLKRHGGNNYLLRGSEFIGKAKSLEKFAMVNAGFPAAMKRDFFADNHGYILGELWQVDSKTLSRLDALEGEGHMYHRETSAFECTTCPFEKAHSAYVYVGSPEYFLNRPQFIPDPHGNLEFHQ